MVEIRVKKDKNWITLTPPKGGFKINYEVTNMIFNMDSFGRGNTLQTSCPVKGNKKTFDFVYLLELVLYKNIELECLFLKDGILIDQGILIVDSEVTNSKISFYMLFKNRIFTRYAGTSEYRSLGISQYPYSGDTSDMITLSNAYNDQKNNIGSVPYYLPYLNAAARCYPLIQNANFTEDFDKNSFVNYNCFENYYHKQTPQYSKFTFLAASFHPSDGTVITFDWTPSSLAASKSVAITFLSASSTAENEFPAWSAGFTEEGWINSLVFFFSNHTEMMEDWEIVRTATNSFYLKYKEPKSLSLGNTGTNLLVVITRTEGREGSNYPYCPIIFAFRYIDEYLAHFTNTALNLQGDFFQDNDMRQLIIFNYKLITPNKGANSVYFHEIANLDIDIRDTLLLFIKTFCLSFIYDDTNKSVRIDFIKNRLKNQKKIDLTKYFLPEEYSRDITNVDDLDILEEYIVSENVEDDSIGIDSRIVKVPVLTKQNGSTDKYKLSFFRGMQNCNNVNQFGQYPCATHDNLDTNDAIIGNYSLELEGEYGLKENFWQEMIKLYTDNIIVTRKALIPSSILATLKIEENPILIIDRIEYFIKSFKGSLSSRSKSLITFELIKNNL